MSRRTAWASALFVLAAACLSSAVGSPSTFPCLANTLAFNFSLSLQPFRPAPFRAALRDSLNATACGGFPDRVEVAPWVPARVPPAAHRLHVDPSRATPGSYATVADAVDALRALRAVDGEVDAEGRPAGLPLLRPVRPATISLAPGAHRVGAHGLRLGPADSSIAFVGERGADGLPLAWLTGAVALPLHAAWAPFNLSRGANVWVLDVRAWLSANGADGIDGLRVAGARATRARFPNADPERDGFGSALRADAWLPPATFPPATQFSPAAPSRNVTGNYTRFALGVGGACSVFSPPASLWCSTERTQSGGDALFQLPTGLTASRAVLPHAPYAAPTSAIVHAFRPSRWESYMWTVRHAVSDAGSTTLTFGSGGFQGARGCAAGEAFFIENVMEELDAPGEFFYDAPAGRLYLWHNASSGVPPPTSDGTTAGAGVEVPLARVIVNYTGSLTTPVVGVVFSDIGFRDARATFLDPHGVPSGGDWALARAAALYIEGTVDFVVNGCTFSRVDGNALLAYGYTRGLNVTRNEFAWTGGTAVALWGETTGADSVGVASDGPDGTAGTHPAGTLVDSNFIHELGIYEKQSAAIFQAKTAASTITRNVAMNMPRAAILLNDGFGGGTVVARNAAWNTVRETGPPPDHGPVNFWDRVAYEWLDGATGLRTSTKAVDVVQRNLLIGTYWTSTPVDTDDGTRFVDVVDNVMVGGTMGAKQPFAGARLAFARNLHAYVGIGYHLFHPPDAGWAFSDATLVQELDGDYGVKAVCAGDSVTLGGNRVMTPTGNVTECGEELAAWVAAGHDLGSTAGVWPADGDLLAAAAALLFAGEKEFAGVGVVL